MTDTKLVWSDLLDSLTGYEEDKITGRFGGTIGDLMNNVSFSKGGRALLFVVAVREGAKEAEAYKKVMAMTLADLSAQIVLPGDEDPDAEDADPEEPDTPLGDSGSQPA